MTSPDLAVLRLLLSPCLSLDVAFGITLSYKDAIACVTVCIRECKCATERQPGSSSPQ
ncbi:hypothetical protein H6F74_07455 [Trichocoleus sp. FACHB-90]|uniref:hypothetical protein n=1 Tax=Cyanophyceae TaxID=3028117 RepID=UPI001682E10D|nr:hypothetical protein [Trichocoleus sp. FACHB-90]MBD1926090.1 hypothetical protein [Trichocoleus sp. FACHB-90]